MGHKVHPTGIRLGIAKDWTSKWFAGKRDYAQYLAGDLKVRDMLRAKLAQAGVSDNFTYISTAGGAFLEWMEGRVLPGVAALEV